MSKHDAWLHGEIGDDGSHPNSPNYREPEFDMSDAAANVANNLVKLDGVALLVGDVAGSRGLLDWIAHNVELPSHYRDTFRTLDSHARELGDEVVKEYGLLNGRAA